MPADIHPSESSLALDPLSPLPAARDPRWFVPAHPAGSSRTANLRARRSAIPAPEQVFPAWRRAQLEVDRLAGEALVAPRVLRTTGFLSPQLADRIADWFTGKPAARTGAVRRSYRALERETHGSPRSSLARRPPAASASACAMSAARASRTATRPSSVPSCARTGR